MSRDFPNLVNGEWVGAGAGGWLDVHNPADRREVVGRVPAMAAADVAALYESAAAAAAAWARTSPIDRGRVLLRTATLLRERAPGIAADLTGEMGKTLAEAGAEVGKSADFFEYYGGFGRAPWGSALADERPGARAWTVREPLGVVAAITPWNDPLLTPARKLAPALIAGNAVLLKAASYTPLVGHHLARALHDAGLPAGVLGTVSGPTSEIGDALIEDPRLAAISFTGSNEVGEHLRRRAAERGVELLAELGGKNAAVVLADADLELAARTIAAAGLAQAGQRCTATSRIIADASVVEELQELLAAAAMRMVIGPGLAEGTTLGPLVSDAQRETVAGFVEGARSEGAEVLAGGAAPGGKLEHGSFFEPTVLAGVGGEMPVWREEVFGPVLAVREAAGLEAALAQLNDSPYGLAAAVYTRDLDAAEEFALGADVGQVAINLPTSGWDVHMPFGGFKASGSGHKEQGAEGIEFYTRTKTIAVARRAA